MGLRKLCLSRDWKCNQKHEQQVPKDWHSQPSGKFNPPIGQKLLRIRPPGMMPNSSSYNY
jgi:hypothetical protein